MRKEVYALSKQALARIPQEKGCVFASRWAYPALIGIFVGHRYAPLGMAQAGGCSVPLNKHHGRKRPARAPFLPLQALSSIDRPVSLVRRR